jgi:AcrR family transcriptional regulator
MKKPSHRREETRARIVDQADALFRQYGYTKTNVADIAGELAMSTANIYKFFPSKNAIIQAAADRNLIQIKERLLRAARMRKSASARLLDIVLSIYTFHEEVFRHERQIYQLVLAATEENWSCVRLFQEFLADLIAGVIEEGVRAREFRRTDPRALTKILLDCFTWITNPILFREIDPKHVESRARAQMKLLQKALS